MLADRYRRSDAASVDHLPDAVSDVELDEPWATAMVAVVPGADPPTGVAREGLRYLGVQGNQGRRARRPWFRSYLTSTQPYIPKFSKCGLRLQRTR